MKGKWRHFTAELKAQVALGAIRGELTVAEIAAKHGIHPTMITGWQKHAVGGLATIFDGKAETKDTAGDGEVEKLHAKIRKLVVERDFLSKAFGL